MIFRHNLNKITFTFLSFSLLIGCKSDTYEIFTNEPEGFREYKWGTRFDEIEGMEISDPVAIKIDLPYFVAVKTNENLDIYGTRASTITYYFEDDLLVSVFVSIPSKEGFEKARKYCFNVYGHTKNQSNESDNVEYIWSGGKTRIKLSHVSYQKYPSYGEIILSSSNAENESKSDIKIGKFSHILDSMETQIKYNKNWFCGFGRSFDFQEKYEYYNAFLCKLYDLSDKETGSVFDEIRRSGIVKPEYYYFSVFIENSDDQNESWDETLYEESEIGLFPSIDKCNDVAQFALTHTIPTRQCRSWKSYTDYMNKILEPLSQQDQK